ncbi:hypothetical protein VV02_07295 [Luteipulveratus mongoliensis]|uniref:Lipoprotein n=2 Tax=Luteipulveratus mongoliensis TaxID=571913 RepID=A0A0K1JG71_9MICO|nr:hypothetical protein VV02_07295 [Luteipulveratus mongoliensis]
MRPATSPRRARALASAGALGAAVLLSSCMSLSQQTTELKYDAADGVSATVGDLQVSDLLVVTSGKGTVGSLHGMVTNNGEAPAQLSIQPQGGKAGTISVPGLSAVRLDGQPSGNSTAPSAPLKIASVTTAPGAMLTISFKTPAGTTAVQTPVLLDQHPYGTATVTHAPDEQPTEQGDVAEAGGH